MKERTLFIVISSAVAILGGVSFVLRPPTAHRPRLNDVSARPRLDASNVDAAEVTRLVSRDDSDECNLARTYEAPSDGNF